MKGKTKESNGSYIEKEGGKEAEDNPFSREIVSGDLLWIKLHKSSRWPAQVVDENTVSGINKPSYRSAGEVLVRLYGSYKYLYVDPIRCHLEFENILKVNNGNCGEILKKALEQDLTRIKSRRSKVQRPKSKENPGKECWKRKQVQKKLEPNSPQSKRVLSSGQLFSENTEAKSGIEKQDWVHKKLKMSHPSSVRMSPRRLSASTKAQTLVRDGNLLSEQAEGAKTKNEREDGVQKKLEKLKTDHPGSVRRSPRQLSSATKPQTLVRDGNLLSEKGEGEKTKWQKEDGVQKKLEPSPTSQTPKKVGIHKNPEPNGAESATTSVRKPQELSARKTKIMLSLGLTAPSGSPFHRNGYISPSPVL